MSDQDQPDSPRTPHTPGPWHLRRAGDYVPGYDVCELSHAGGPCGGTVTADVMLKPGEEIANGHAIAAVPELLAACRAIWAAPESSSAFALVLAAIAKAEGRS